MARARGIDPRDLYAFSAWKVPWASDSLPVSAIESARANPPQADPCHRTVVPRPLERYRALARAELFLEPTCSTDERFETRTWVRRNAGTAAIAAVLMLYFGFAQLAEPGGTDLFSRCNLVFYHALRVGGVAMTIIAVWSWFGYPSALMVDSVVSVVIGVVFMLTGAGMLVDGGASLQSVLIVIFGGMFLSAGIRSRRVYARIAPTGGPASVFDGGFERRHVETASTPALRPDAMTPPSEQKRPLPLAESRIDEKTLAEEGRGPPTEGYLAALAENDPPPKE